MKFVPAKNKISQFSALLMFIVGFTLFAVSGIAPITPFAFQILALISFTFGIQILQRYVLATYTYFIEDTDKGAVFDVVRTMGSKSITVCSVELSKCIYYGDENGFKDETENSFDYRQNIFSGNRFILIYKESASIYKIRIEAESNLVFELGKRILNDNFDLQ